jgi:anti-sigma regulatory factor (Ser/Thr protein kinase)
MNVMVPIQAVRRRESRLRMPRLPHASLPEPRWPDPLLRVRRVRLDATPAAAAAARRRVLAVIRAWRVPVDPDIAVLLTSELVTNAIAHEPGETVTLHVSSANGRLLVEVFDTCPQLPVPVDAAAAAPADAETGRGLMLVATLAVTWGCYRTPAGKAVWFALGPVDLAPLDAVSAR